MSFYILILFLIFSFLFRINLGSDLNVGTTLFTRADSYKECWSSESLALLTSRMILEDLLPSTSILVIDCNEFVSDLVEYFRIILETVRQETHGKMKHITLLALTDLLGGYLYHAVLPIAKYAYYSGLIDFDSMATLLGLFDELKWFLRTNGQGWAKPLCQNLENLEIQRIPLQTPIDKDKCNNLIYVQGEHPEQQPGRCDEIIPLPFFDSLTKPSAIALPTKSCPLYNVEANSSSYLVMKFFITSYKCLQMKGAKTEDLEQFQRDFCGWIDEQIMPRLQDEKFYSAFGGILRVRFTLKRLGVSRPNFEKQLDEFKHPEEGTGEGRVMPNEMSRSATILIAVLITIFVWFILGTMFICYKMRASKQKDNTPEGGEKSTTCSSLLSSKYCYPESRNDKGTASPSRNTSRNRNKVQTRRIHHPRDSLQYQKLNWSRHKGRRHEITIRTCMCHDNDDEGDDATLTPTSASVVESSTEHRLPLIAEMSEQSTSTSRRMKKSPGGSTTPGSQDTRFGKVQKHVYMDSESESEDTSEPA